MTDRQCSSCGGFCKKSGCERENVKPEPDPKPVAWRSSNWSHSDADYIYRDYDDPALLSNGEVSPHNEPLYTAPPHRKPLSEEEICDKWITAMQNTEGTRLPIPEFARAIEAAHGIGGNNA